jgi:hypothetical protein
MAEDTKENVNSKAALTAEKVVPAIAQCVANALAASALKDASVLAMIDRVLIEEAVAVSIETIIAAGVVQAEALEQVRVLQAAATLKVNLAAPEETVEVSSRKVILELKE